MGRSIRARSWWWISILLLAACAGPPQAPDPDPDPGETAAPFVITSPVTGSRVSGAVLFAIQVLDAARFQGAELYVGGQRVLPQFPGETPLRVYLIPRDHPEGPLELRAVVRSAGANHARTVQVQVVHEPPSSATVGASGAVVGDAEASGAISTVTIPAGTASGATVQFETFTQAEVLASTGVDYDGLGVTFLGAQEVRSSIPTGDGVAMTSGGFGPMVQPGQTVVSYRILSDAGRGVGELMVINGASVAPNGDVVSNPPVVPQGDLAVATSALGTQTLAVADGGLRTASTLPAGPPGTFIEVPATGLNVYAVDGYYARFRVGATTVETPATVGLNGDGRQYLFVVVPPLPAGAATVDLVWKAGDTVFASYAMNVTAPQAFTGSTKAIVDANYAALLDALDAADDDFLAQGIALPFGPVRAALASVRAELAALPATDPRIVNLARSLYNGGLTASALEIRSVVPLQTSAACILNARKYTTDKELARRAFRGDQSDAGLKGLTGNLSLAYLDRFADRLEDFPEYECDPYKEFLCEELGNCGDDEVVEPWDDDVPNDPLPRPWRAPAGSLEPSDWVTGMGSAVWSGGPLGGALRDDGVGGSSLAWSGDASVARVTPRRYVVRAAVNGLPLPFATSVAEDGYFFLPLLPAGQTIQIVITDLDSGRECFQDVVGRAVGSAVAIYVDFAACAGDPVDPGEYTIRWIGGFSQNWTDAQNWEPERLPNADDDVWIPGSATELLLPAGFEFQPPAVVTLRSLRSQGTVGVGNTVLQTTGAVHFGTFWVYNPAASVQAGGGFTYDGVHAAYSTGGGFTLPAGDVTLTNVITSGTLVVPGTLTVTGALTFLNGGALSGAGTTVVPAGVTAAISASSIIRTGQVVGGHTLEVRGELILPVGLGGGNGTGFQVLDGATVEVAPGGVMTMSGITVISGNGTGTIRNLGRVEVVGTNADVIVQNVPVENDGVWSVATGGDVSIEGDTAVFRNGAAGELTGPGSTSIGFQGVAEFVGGSITGGHRFVNQAGQFGGATWVASGAAPLTIEAGSEIVNAPNPSNLQLSTFVVANTQVLSGGGTFRNQAVLRKAGGGTSNWTGVCYVVEGGGSYVEESGSIDFGSCP